MAHIVPNPPPRDYQVPTLTNFSVLTASGQADVLAWGFPSSVSAAEYMIALESTGYDGMNRVESEPVDWPYPELVRFKVSGLRGGDKIAVFRNSNFGTPWPKPNWVKHSASVKVDTVSADTYAALAGRLPPYARNTFIKFYPFGSMQRKTPVSEPDWLASVTATLDEIMRHQLGASLIRLISSDVIIYPWVRSFQNATSEVLFSPQDWPPSYRPGQSVDEILFHELVHVIERNARGYSDRPGFQFDGSDFLTVNATNVYSCLLGRGLRKDHHGFEFLPPEYFQNPRLHYDLFASNYNLALSRTPALYGVLKSSSKLWNPFIF